MQISNNYQQSPNFGMAMILEKSARPALEEGGMKMVEALKQAQGLVGKTKKVDLIIGEGAVPTITTPFANKYTKYFEASLNRQYPEFLNIKTIWAGYSSGNLKTGDSFQECIKLANTNAAQRAYTDLATEQNTIVKAAKLAKILDDKYIAEEALENAQKAEKATVKKELDSLYEQFGHKPVEI